MRMLHMLRSSGDPDSQALIEAFPEYRETTIALYDDNVDWEALVDEIFASDAVISWW